ncbi:MAG: fibronectin type III domain-containing protein [Chitinispirillaceae bacterium]|nr:fibronectin type III domain-containing protein [Chitinispirillaceae bacterium]
MRWKTVNILYPALILFFINSLNAEYVEGIDTTEGRYGLDSMFFIDNGCPKDFNGKILGYYYFDQDACVGYYNYFFNEIKIAPEIYISSLGPNDRHFCQLEKWRPIFFGCFVLKNKTENNYSKVKILEQLSDGRFIYRYGTNTTKNERVLVKQDFDQSVRYKVNNLHNYADYSVRIDDYNWCIDTLSWDPPLPNNNHLLGYILYKSKSTMIDTTRPIDLAQWDSVAFFDSNVTKVSYPELPRSVDYFNMVAVYEEGRSDFLDGWSLCRWNMLNARKNVRQLSTSLYAISVKNFDASLYISLPGKNYNTVPSLDILTIGGRRVASLHVSCPTFSLNAAQAGIPSGAYVLRIASPGRETFTWPVSLVR